MKYRRSWRIPCCLLQLREVVITERTVVFGFSVLAVESLRIFSIGEFVCPPFPRPVPHGLDQNRAEEGVCRVVVWRGHGTAAIVMRNRKKPFDHQAKQQGLSSSSDGIVT
jgi:hypothetical protein